MNVAGESADSVQEIVAARRAGRICIPHYRVYNG